jgi:ABC-type Mn2+/Zn2+ transport system permease subunit
MFALGVALISTVRSYTVDLTHFLFGDVLGVGPRDLILTIVFGLAIILMVIAFFKEFLILSFDPILAGTLRLPTVLLEYLLVGLIALAVVVSLQTVGVALMVAMLVTPAATGYLLSRRLSTMMLLAAFYAAFSAVVGLYLSYYLNIASGAAIVLTTTTLFGLTWLVVTIRQRRTIQAQIAEQVGHR